MPANDWRQFTDSLDEVQLFRLKQAFTDGLNGFQLVLLKEAIDETEAERGHIDLSALVAPAYGHYSTDPPSHSFTCTSSALHDSVRSARQANSAHSDDTLLGQSLWPLSHVEQGLSGPYEGEENVTWKTTQAAENGLFRHPPFDTEDHGKEKAASHRRSPASNIAEPRLNPRFFCTYCHELDIRRSFNTKHDWKRHETKFHETGYEWHCRSDGCLEVFARESDFVAHSERDHEQEQVMPDIVPIPEQRVYACGFEGCKKLTYNWKDRCDHVARCMADRSVEWSYTWKILNLLRHTDIRPTWKRVKCHWCIQLGLSTSDLRWDCKATHNMRLQLESLGYGNDLETFLETLLRLGHPKFNVTPGFHSHPTRLESLAPVPNAVPNAVPNEYGHDVLPLPVEHTEQRCPGPNSFGTVGGRPPSDNAKRYSVAMPDAPPLDDIHTTQYSTGPPATTLGGRFEEWLFSPTYSVNPTPPFSNSVSPTGVATSLAQSMASPGRGLFRKSMERLRPRKLQSQQQTAIAPPNPSPTYSTLELMPSTSRDTTAAPSDLEGYSYYY